MTTSSGAVTITSSNASSASAGGSVLDVGSLVSQLVNAAQSPQASIITSQTKTVTTQISALGSFKGALSTFQSSLGALDTASAFALQTASSSNTAIFTASTGSSAVPGSYSVTVAQLAQAQQLVSKPVVGGSSATVGTGSLTVSLGTSSFNITVDSTNNTVAGIAAAINSATGNPGVTATVVSGTDGAHLVLSSSLTGAANNIQVSESDGGTALAAFTYGTGNTGNYKENSAAQDAQFSIAGVAYTNASNTVSNAISGVTLNLTATTTSGSSATLTVAGDTKTITANISAFVAAYNTMQSTLASLGSYDPSSGTAGPMLGDSLLQGMQNQLRQTLNSVVNTGSSAYNTLTSIGITSKSDGTLTLDSTKLANALATNSGAVTQLFSSTTGVAKTLNSQLTTELATNGAVDSRSQTLVKQNNALSKEQTDLTTQMAALSSSLTTQFSTLNTLLSKLQTTSAYLTQAFASLPSNSNNSNG